MDHPASTSREVALPARAFRILRQNLRKEAGPLATIHGLHAAGYEAGTDLWNVFVDDVEDDPSGLDDTAFWERLSDFFGGRGWGTFVHSSPHEGLGMLVSPDWAEAGDDAAEDQPACTFSAGMLSAFFTRAADGPVAVLQISCRARGDDECSFVFGSEATVHDLYGLLLDGHDFDTALGEL